MQSRLFLVSVILFSLSVWACAQSTETEVKSGLEVIAEEDFALLKGLRVGLVTNPTGVNRELQSNIDLFLQSPNVNLVALFGPEHGAQGNFSAGDKVSGYVDEETGLKVFSLYGSTRKPTPDMLEDIDILVFDIQDIGVRSYTYISTLGLVMEAVAENDKKLIVLDRPNPLGGMRVEGNVAEEGFYSFVSQFPIPYVYGLTIGELAVMMNEEAWLANGVHADLEVIQMEGWSRTMTFADTGLPWVPTSPHIPHIDSPFYYVSSGIMGELGTLSEGVGYTIPFQLFGADWIEAEKVSTAMNKLNLEGVHFRPIYFKPYYGRDEGKDLQGVQVHFSDPEKVHLMTLQFYFMQVLHQLYPNRNPLEEAAEARLRFFDLVAGSDQIRLKFAKAFLVADIIDYLNKDVQSFTQKSQQYHLYE